MILPKKTYCPWRPENVERVLRDERLERERLEGEERERIGEERRRRARLAEAEAEAGSGGAAAGDDGGHLNLFPEARDAELRLVRGRKAKEDALRNNGIMPVPLGGDESTKRRSGAVPFYMRRPAGGDGDGPAAGGRYEGSGGLGYRRNRRDVPSDAVTDGIMRDQYASREDSRKSKMDPMCRFFANGADGADRRRSGGQGAPPASVGAKRGVDDGGPDGDSDSHRRRRKGKRKKRSRRDGDGDESDPPDDGGRKRSGRKKSKRRHRGRHEDDAPDAPDEGPRDAVEELRRRRMAREARESARERDVLDGTRGGVSGWRRDDRTRGYQDQFNPAFSRK